MLANALAPLALLILQQQPQDTQPHSCLSYYGSSTTGKYAFFGTSDDVCLSDAVSFLDSGSLVNVVPDTRTELVWLESETGAVEASLVTSQPEDALTRFLRNIESANTIAYAEGTQHTLANEHESTALEVLHQDASSMLLRVDHSLASSVDTFLPQYWRSMILPRHARPYIPVPEPAVGRVKEILSHVKFDPVVASLVNNISVAQMKSDIRYLTGEDPKSNILSRHSFSDGVRVAAKWLKERFEETGATCRLEPFLAGFGPNVIWYAEPDRLRIIC